MKRNPNQRPAHDEAIEATAAAWLAERDAGLSVEDAAEFERWRAADPRHRLAVERLEGAWLALQQLREFRPDARAHPDRNLLARPRTPRGSRLSVFATAGALAACAAVTAFVWWPRGESVRPAPSWVQYTTTVGGYQRMTLSDGSIVDLNANTEIMERFTSVERAITLVRGEATFTVTKDPARPFVVVAAGARVRAVGTAFNVRLGSDKVEVMVTEGRVQLERALSGTTPAPREVALPEVVAGQRVIIPKELHADVQPVVQEISPAVVREELSWQQPQLMFVDTPLAEVVRQFNASNRLQLELADPTLGGMPVVGRFRAENVEAFVRLLVADNEIVAEHLGPERIVLRRAP